MGEHAKQAVDQDEAFWKPLKTMKEPSDPNHPIKKTLYSVFDLLGTPCNEWSEAINMLDTAFSQKLAGFDTKGIDGSKLDALNKELKGKRNAVNEQSAEAGVLYQWIQAVHTAHHMEDASM